MLFKGVDAMDVKRIISKNVLIFRQIYDNFIEI